MVIDHNYFMNLALQEAWKYQGLTYPNPAVGCTILGPNNELLAVNAHQKSGEPHAEVMALKDAYYLLTNDTSILNLTLSSDIHKYLLQNHNNCFINCSVYTTLEPCSHEGKTPSCAKLLAKLQVKKVYIGSNDFNVNAANGLSLLEKSNIKVQTQLLEQKCDELLFPFKKYLSDSFVFFKWAQRLNGTIDGGAISSVESRTDVHAMRDVCDLLVIGANTVRTDRPTLDARLVNGKAPDVLIISKSKEIDKTIPLFNVKNRQVFVENNFDRLSKYKNVMIEGTPTMYELSRDIVDYYLCYVAPDFGGSYSFTNMNDKFEILNVRQEAKDIIMWMKRI